MYNPRSTSPLPRSEPYRHVSVSPNSVSRILSPNEQKSNIQFDITAEAYRQALRTVMQGGGGSTSKRVSPPRSYSRSRSPIRAPVYKSPLAPPPVEEKPILPPTPPQPVVEQLVQPPPPSPKTTAVQTDPIPDPEPIVLPPSPMKGDRAKLQQRLLEIDTELASERESIRKSVSRIEDLDHEKSSIEEILLNMLDNESKIPAIDEERKILETALFESRQQVANLKQRETEYDSTMNELRDQLAEAIRCLMEEKARNEELQKRPVQESSPPPKRGYPVVGMELGEGAPYKIPGVWVVSVVEGGAADKAGILAGDVLTEVAGIPVRTRAAFREVMAEIDPPQQGHQHVMSFRLTREVDGTNINKSVMVTLGWSSRKPEGRRTVTVQLSPRLGNRSPSPPKIKERSTTPGRT